MIGLFLMGLIGLAATETFVNKTGKNVYGIRVTFSTKVTIIRHDYVFPDQDPASGRSAEFTFSGGKLHKFKRFTIVWIPGTAEVVDYEWLEEEVTAPPQEETEAPPEQEAQPAGPSLPDPNTPPILYGDDYPGPDEPLYQPQPDEQIWLTDLEGHGDIYDNDGIRINYAPGFDKSRISVIRVYRNGVFMRFLPEKFDVLTNAQMKTFDGNPLEHIPASAHTDHAIMGYEYEFDIYTADHLWVLKKTVKSGFRWHPKEVWAEMDGAWIETMRRLSYNTMLEFFRDLKEDGFTGVSLDIAYYMNTPYDNTVLELKQRDTSIIPWGIRTPSNSELENILKAISEAGMDAHVRGVIYISKKYQDIHGPTFRDSLAPNNPKLYFDNYTNLFLKLVPILNKYHVKLLSPFTEPGGLKNWPELIREVHTKISEKFTGEIGFEEATANMLNGLNPLDRPITSTKEFKSIDKDYAAIYHYNRENSREKPIRIEYSCWTPPLETQKDQRVSVMEPNFVKFWGIPVGYYRETYPQDPQMFGEIGVYDVDGVGLGSEIWHMSNYVFDYQEVADIWYVYLKGAKELGINSLNVWVIPLGDFWYDDTPGPGHQFINIGLRQPEMPAYRVITAIIGPED